jgi:hypothetical protein
MLIELIVSRRAIDLIRERTDSLTTRNQKHRIAVLVSGTIPNAEDSHNHNFTCLRL